MSASFEVLIVCDHFELATKAHCCNTSHTVAAIIGSYINMKLPDGWRVEFSDWDYGAAPRTAKYFCPDHE